MAEQMGPVISGSRYEYLILSEYSQYKVQRTEKETGVVSNLGTFPTLAKAEAKIWNTGVYL
jgi:hypothetical protein